MRERFHREIAHNLISVLFCLLGLHHLGPKKYETWILCLGLIVKQVYRLSYRRAAKFLSEYYSVSLHQWLLDNGSFSIALVRKNCKRGKHRKFLRDYFDWSLYWQRNIVEALFGALKRLFGTHLASKHIKTQTTEIFCRLIAYNVGYCLITFSTEPHLTGVGQK